MHSKRFYIAASATISHQPTFRNPGFSQVLEGLGTSSELISPDYKAFIDAGLLRRMSKILRMSVACSKACLAEAAVYQPDAIVVGTGLGCLQDTEKFLNTSISVEGLLPPTSFIQSTHNTMAGQISLSIGNHGYNMTHTQNTLSFEHALLDAMLLIAEGGRHILTGAADEYIELLSEISDQLALKTVAQLTSAASFFLLSAEAQNSKVAIRDCAAIVGVTDPVAEIIQFLEQQHLHIQDVDAILHAGPVGDKSDLFTAGTNFEQIRNIAYLPLSGVYPTASAFALDYAQDLIISNESVKRVLIVNLLRENYLGLTLAEAIET